MSISETLATSPPLKPEPPPERLRIVHFFLWMTLTAVVISLRFPDPPSPAYRVALFLGEAMLFSLGIAAIAVAAIRFFQSGAGCPTQPGHWLLFVLGLRGLSTIARWHCPQAVEFSSPELQYVFLTELILSTEVLFLAALCNRQPWRLLFCLGGMRDLGLIGVGFCVPNRTSWMLIPLWGTSYLYLLLLLLFASYDARRGPPRDSIHWIGVIACLLYGTEESFGDIIVDLFLA